MPRINVDSVKKFPVYEIDETGDEASVSEEQLARWRKVLKEYAIVQRELAQAWASQEPQEEPDGLDKG